MPPVWDWRGWGDEPASTMDVTGFLEEFDEAAVVAGFSVTRLGEVEGWPLSAYEKITPGRPTVYLSAGIHGDEPAGPAALLRLLEDGVFDDRASWLLCPALNPWGLAHASRENAEGRDLNRDYLSRECREVALHGAWLDALPAPDFFISLHEDWETSGFYFYEIDTSGQSSFAEEILEAVAPVFGPEPLALIDDHAVTAPGWIYHPADSDFPEDWPEAIYIAKRGCPLSFTFETPSAASWEARIAAHILAARQALDCWAKRLAQASC